MEYPLIIRNGVAIDYKGIRNGTKGVAPIAYSDTESTPNNSQLTGNVLTNDDITCP